MTDTVALSATMPPELSTSSATSGSTNAALVDLTSASSASLTKREEMLSHLQQSNLDRLHSQDLKRQQRSLNAAYSSTSTVGLGAQTVAFLSSFHTQLSGITAAILSSTQPSHLTPLGQQLTALQSSLNHSCHLLPPHDVSACQAELSDAADMVARQKELLQPRPKFHFRSRLNQPVNHAAAPGTATGTAAGLGDERKETLIFAAAPAAPAPVLPGFHGLQNERLMLLSSSCPSRPSLHLSRLARCTVQLLLVTSSLHLSHLTDCTVTCGPTVSSILVTHCNHCTFRLSSQQLRIHHTDDSHFSLFTASHPIIEHSHTIVVDAAYDVRYGGSDDDNEAVGKRGGEGGRRNGAAERVEDFNWSTYSTALPRTSHTLDGTVADKPMTFALCAACCRVTGCECNRVPTGAGLERTSGSVQSAWQRQRCAMTAQRQWDWPTASSDSSDKHTVGMRHTHCRSLLLV